MTTEEIDPGSPANVNIWSLGEGIEFWDNFLNAIYYLHYTCNAPIASIRKLTGLEKIRLGWNSGIRQPLRELIRECRYRRASDPRDKIYSLLGLMGDAKNDLLKPDYNKTVAEVYARATQHLIRQGESLDAICGWQTPGRDSLPSWVPDYNLNQDLAATPLVSIDGRESLFAASGYDWQAKYHLTNIEEWRFLPVTGFYIDTVSMPSDAIFGEESFGYMETMWHSTILAAGHLLGGLTSDIELGLEVISSAVSKYSEYWHSTGTPYTQSLHSSSNLSLSLDSAMQDHLSSSDNINQPSFDKYVLDAYIQCLVCGRQNKTERLSKRNAQGIIGFWDDTAPSNDEVTALICQAFEAGMRGRSLGVTTSGYIGAMPQDVHAGDMVCVLFGCSVPVVLRQSDEDGLCSFVGECYLHGFMDAEAIVHQMKGLLEQRDFILV